MPRQAARKQFLNFVGGLHTEASPLTFPENTAKDLDNVDLLRNGSVRRRRGLIKDATTTGNSDTFSGADIQTDALSVHIWDSVGEDGASSFLVLQLGTTLLFHDLEKSSLTSSYLGSVDLSDSVIHPDAKLEVISAAGGRGKLFVGNKHMEPTYIEYKGSSFIPTKMTLKIRDLEGVEDDLEIDERPSTLSNEHNYNLRNQGWPNPDNGDHPFKIYLSKSNNFLGNPIEVTKTDIGVYPSNADILYLSKIVAAASASGIGAYDPDQLGKYYFGNTRAARGHFILDAFDRNRETASGQSDLYVESRDKDTVRPISIAFYAGRVWYLMPNGRLLYSQVLEDVSDVSKAERCYQDADPTAEDINELIATDGGTLEIAGIGKAVKLLTVGPELLIFAENGVWSVSGADQSVFSATSQYINKITHVGAIGADNILPIEDLAVYWSHGGIYFLSRNEIGALTPTNITETTIQTFYDSIGPTARRFARGAYDKQDRKIYWLYNDTSTYDGVNSRFVYNRALIFDVVLNAFYTYSFPTDIAKPEISAFFEKENEGTIKGVVFSNEIVQTNSQGRSIRAVSTNFAVTVGEDALSHVWGYAGDGSFGSIFFDPPVVVSNDEITVTVGKVTNSRTSVDFDTSQNFRLRLDGDTGETFEFTRIKFATAFDGTIIYDPSHPQYQTPAQSGGDHAWINVPTNSNEKYFWKDLVGSNAAITVEGNVFEIVDKSLLTYTYSFAAFGEDALTDWDGHQSQPGVEYSSYIETGYDILEDVIAEKEANTVYTFFEDTGSNSSCLMQAKWQWADSATSNRWTDPQQVYRVDPRVQDPYPYSVVQTINQVRGKGRSLQLRFESEGNSDFHLLGWSTPFTVITGA